MYDTDSTAKSKLHLQSTLGDRPIRILHVVGQMVRGGIETWLMHVLRHIDRDRFLMDFLVLTTQPGDYDEEIRALGSRIIPCPLDRWNPWSFAANFKRILREYGPYDIVHSHPHLFSGYVLRLAKQAGVPVRIAHSHNDSSLLQAQAGLYRRLYSTVMKHWIDRYATLGLGCARPAVAALFGANWESDPRWQVLYYGIDLKGFRDAIDPVKVRAELNIPVDAIVIGHVGRFAKQKNHLFLLKIAAEVAKREPKTYLLLIGDGVLRPRIEQEVAQLGLTDRVIFAGVRSDISRLMRGAMDIFLFPSFYEGLPLVSLEAQAAGLPCIFSDVITEEVDAVKPLVQRLSLSQPASVWADAVLARFHDPSVIKQSEAMSVIEQSSLNIEKGIEALVKLYSLNASKSYQVCYPNSQINQSGEIYE
ncbi:glycosyltransferase family 1 protein [Phormidium sp. LEGE 05292]|uniref:glycosyltransferase family 1 protein n=1 Tax=[Phormidium] sp. LEGE 05292 TaxID=767427 RepID=UPI0018817F4B|nr:glycosyltransferase family 1 protein [Phormidium sp. LEGE 05292]MBE9223916.1 glycosyltransferase family 1 protein [Phormidium sp. LEGE 05292]